jgi:hypothetical protein
MDEKNRQFWYKHARSKINEKIASLTKKSDKGIAVATEVEKEDESIKYIDLKSKEIKRPIKGNKIFWAHAKDDISPKELFALYRGSDKDRGVIAKYCIMDCVLVTKLMEKLQVLNNNIGMANVCNVPLNYIFMRY